MRIVGTQCRYLFEYELGGKFEKTQQHCFKTIAPRMRSKSTESNRHIKNMTK